MKKSVKITIGVLVVITLLFIIDLIFIFTINKPLLAIKEDNGDSVNLIYRGLFYDTYNCHEYSIPQIKSKGSKFTCIAIKYDEKIESKYEPITVENVSISISNISSTGATITIKDTNKEKHTYGQWYKIEKQANGKWYELNTLINNYAFISIGYLPDKNNEVKFVMDWKSLYGKLPLGNYRILKQANEKIISVEFSIEKPTNDN